VGSGENAKLLQFRHFHCAIDTPTQNNGIQTARKLKMTNLTTKRAVYTKIACSALLIGGLAGVTHASAQSQQETQRQTDLYYHYIKPQQDKQAADAAAIMARPSNWGPGEIRDAANYGALAWYQKGPNQYGYVFNQGSIRDISASMNVEMECSRLRITCEGMMVVRNQWLVIGSYNNRVHFATATGPTRAAAEAVVQEQCRRDGTSCTIKDAFEVMPHRRGASFQRQKMVVR
jgi:hypothetical protein